MHIRPVETFIKVHTKINQMDNSTLIGLFEKLLYVRRAEERVCELYPEQEMRCPVHISIGQEATAVGVAANLSAKDMIFSNHRSHSHYLAKGGSLDKFFAELYGKKTGCSKGKGGSMHLVDLASGFMGATPIVSSSIPVAVGAAFTLSMKNSENLVVAFFGDAAVEEGVFHESVNFAKLRSLPVLFFCENNFYSVYSHINVRQPKRKITALARGHGLECYEADGNDVVNVYEVVENAVQRIRKKNGPAFIEAVTYRWKEHCGPNYDNNLGYRTEEEFLEWKDKCPIKKIREKLLAEGIITVAQLELMENQIKKKIDEAVHFAKSSPFPEEEEIHKNVYAD